MRIVFDHQIFSLQEYGGISRYFQELGKKLAVRPGVDLEIRAPLYLNRHIKEGGIKTRGFFVPKLPKITKFAYKVDSMLVKRSLHQNPPDIVHETYYSENAFASDNSNIVLTVYDMIHERLPQYFSKDNPTVLAKLAAVKRADHIICISESTQKDLIELCGVDPKKTSVTYLANSLRAPQSLSKSKSKKLCDTPYLLYVGPRGGYKNFLRLLQAYGLSARLRKDFKLVCFGGEAPTKEEQDTIKSLALPPGKVVYVSGGDDLLAQYYAQATAFVYPSLYEGFGIPPLEAMSLGCPVICSSTSSLPEVGGDAVEYFDPEQENDMKSAIEKVVFSETRLKELRELGYAQEKKFSWEQCAKETQAVYESLGNSERLK
jgi:glycosyltransferase involved in cell wall biosynthesis